MPSLQELIGPETLKALLADLDTNPDTQRAKIRREPTKPYRLMSGKHVFPNPEFVSGYVTAPELSHIRAEVGDVVELTDNQYKAFKDRFIPIDEKGHDVKDADAEVLENAKKAAAKTGEMVDPNQPIPHAKNPLTEEIKAREAAAAAGKKG